MNKATMSLGFSCQTRFTINETYEDKRRMPFDFNITTIDGLILALRTNGESLIHSEEDSSIYTVPKNKRQGITKSGVYFWHDYPLLEDNKTIDPLWKEKISKVTQKYRYIWPRFESILRSGEINKTLILSNSQFNLGNFIPSRDKFDSTFGLDENTYETITRELEEYGARNYQLMFLNCNLAKTLSTRKNIDGARFRTRFFGTLSLPTNQHLANALVIDDPDLNKTIDSICGEYDNQRFIARSGKDTATIFAKSETGEELPVGEITVAPGAFIAVYPGLDQVFTASLEERTLSFSNSHQWNKLPKIHAVSPVT